MVDLRTTYMGLELAHPVVASASPLSKDTDGIRRLEDGGASAVVMFSLFEEQLRRDREAFEDPTLRGAQGHAEATSYFPAAASFSVGPDRYLELIRRARESVRVPVIASLNGETDEGWVDYAKQMQQAGAAAIELNVYFVPTDPDLGGAAVEQRYLDLLQAVRRVVSVPVAVKLSPFFSAFANLAQRLEQAGANALVLFNRFYQPDFDLARREVVSDLHLSTAAEIRLPLLWIALLRDRVRASLAASGGVQTEIEVVKYLMAGADITMTTSALLRHGPAHLGVLRDGLTRWMEQHEYASVAQMKGSMSQRNVTDPSAFERNNYVRALEGYRARADWVR